MKNFYKTCVIGVCTVIATLFNPNQVYASHAQGADISYQCLGGNNYQIVVSFYRDCSGVGAPASVNVNLSSVSCGQNLNLTLFPIGGTGMEVSPICASMGTTCTGGSYPGVQEWKYSGTINLPANCSDWVFSFTLCCRNAAISTINAPGTENIYVEANLDNLNYPCNNSPVFSNPPVPFVCVGQTYCFNHGATDVDGDSLSYSLITPMTGPTTTVTYLGGWSATQPVSSTPALTMDPLTGDICMTPQLLEVTVMAVLVEEWRSGVLIGSVIRDIQVHVISCSNTLPTISGINGTTNFSASACAGSTLSFDIFSIDEDLGQILTVTWNNAITGATFTTAGSPYPTATFTWTPTAADISTTPYCFTVTVTDDACPFNGSQTFAFCITVTGFNVTVTPSDANCGASNGAATSAVSGGTGPYTYNWSSGSTQPFETGLAAGTYTLTVTDAAGCISSTNFNIGSGTAPGNINFTTANVNCYGGSTGSVTATVTGPGGSTSYLWSNGDTTSAISGLTAGIYVLTITTSTGCVSSDSVIVTQPTSPLVASLTKSNVTCNGLNNGTASVAISGGTSPYTISWSTGSSATTITGLNGGYYSCAIIDANGCALYDSIEVIEPTAISVNSNTIYDVTCAGLSNGSCVLAVSGGTGTLSVVWSTSPVQTGTSAVGLTAGTYSFTITDANGCLLTNNITISEPTPLIVTDVSTNITCNGLSDGTIQVTASGGTGPYSIMVNTTGLANGGTLSGLLPGNYTITTTDAHGCSMSQVVSLTEPAPVSLITSPDLTICPGAFITLYAYASGGSGTYTYSWNNGLGNNDTHVINPGMTTTYTVTVTDQNGCSSSIGSTTITVNDINLVNLTVTGNQPICNGDAITLSANVTGGIGTYTYSWNSGVFTGPGPHVFYPTGNITYTVTITDVCGNTLTENIPVVVNPLPVITLPNITASACGSIEVEFSNSVSSNPGDIYYWIIDGINYMGENPSHIFTNSGAFSIQLTVVNSFGCSTTVNSVANIQIFPQAVAVIDAVEHSVGEFNPTIQFINASIFSTTYSWAFGDGGTSSSEEPHHFYDGVGTYTVTMIANNQYGCADTVSMEINIHPEHTLYVPNAFTPNSDGTNDLFLAKGTHIMEYEMMIFDRWGELIFQAQSLDSGWDGTFRGDVAKEDVYVYKIKYKTNENEVLTKEGHVSLLK